MQQFDINDLVSDVIPLYCYHRDANGKLIYINELTAKVVAELQMGDVFNMPFSQYLAGYGLSEKSIAHIERQDERVLRTGQAVISRVESLYPDPQHEPFYFLVTKQPLIRDSKIVGITAYYYDVTSNLGRHKPLYDHLRAERAARRYEMNYLRRLYRDVIGSEPPNEFGIVQCAMEIHYYLRMIINEMPGSVYWKNRDCVYLGANREALELSNSTALQSGIVGRTDFDFAREMGYPDGVAEMWREDDLQVMESDTAKRDIVEPLFLRPDGRRIYQLANKVPLHNRAGTVIGLLGISIDVTKLRETELALRLANTQNKILLDYAADGIMGLNELGHVVFINSYGADLLGYASDELTDAHANLFLNDGREILSNENRAVQRAIEQLTPVVSSEVYLRRKDGSKFPATVSIVQLPDEEHHLEMVMTFSDITKQLNAKQELEAEVLRRTEALRKANEQLKHEIAQRKTTEEELHLAQGKMAHMHRVNTVGEMVVGIAHEVNQPLTSIVQYAGGCIRRLEAISANKDIIMAMNQVCKQAERAGNVVHRLKNFLRKRELIRTDEDINQLINEAISFIKLECKQHNTTLHLELAPELPKGNVDKIQLIQVFLNIITNAMEAYDGIAATHKPIYITSLFEQPDKLIIRFCDRGPGIAEDRVAKIFDPFVSNKKSGMGVGLSISRTIIQALGGQISVESQLGHGTTFTLTLPVMERSKL